MRNTEDRGMTIRFLASLSALMPDTHDTEGPPRLRTDASFISEARLNAPRRRRLVAIDPRLRLAAEMTIGYEF